MTLEAVVFQQQRDPWPISYEGNYYLGGSRSCVVDQDFDFGGDTDDHHRQENGYEVVGQLGLKGNCSPSPVPVELVVQGANNTDDKSTYSSRPPMAMATTCRRKRRRTRNIKNKEEVETQRITHIAVERNRRKLMNDYLAALRSMMPASYAQRGDQASIIGGAINFVKELEQLQQSLEAARRRTNNPNSSSDSIFSDFFTFPQYSTNTRGHSEYMSNNMVHPHEIMGEKGSGAVADVEVTMVESHANIKVLMKKHPRQLLKIVLGLHSLRLIILHLNLTTMDTMILYTFSVKVEDNSQLTSMNEIAADVYEMVGRIQEEAKFSPQQ